MAQKILKKIIDRQKLKITNLKIKSINKKQKIRIKTRNKTGIRTKIRVETKTKNRKNRKLLIRKIPAMDQKNRRHLIRRCKKSSKNRSKYAKEDQNNVITICIQTLLKNNMKNFAEPYCIIKNCSDILQKIAFQEFTQIFNHIC